MLKNQYTNLPPVKDISSDSISLFADIIAEQLYPGIRIVKSLAELKKVRSFRKLVYKDLYPEIADFDSDPYDDDSVVFYHVDESGKINGTLRCAFDSKNGLPDEKLFQPCVRKCRSSDLVVVEAGRTAVLQNEKTTDIITALYAALYMAIKHFNIDVVFISVPQSKVRFHKKIWNVEILEFNTGYTFGSPDQFAALAWYTNDVQTCFFRWIKQQPKNKLNKMLGENK